MFRVLSISFLGLLICLACTQTEKGNTNTVFDEVPFIKGKAEYLSSPYLTAGDRVYMVGHQDGTFPELGWHIKGEMGGIWNHPIKLMDGIDIELKWENEVESLDKALKALETAKRME